MPKHRLAVPLLLTALALPALAGDGYYFRHSPHPGSGSVVPPGSGANDAGLPLAASGLPSSAIEGDPASGRFTAPGARGPLTFSATGLPDGLAMGSDGSLTGTFSPFGAYTAVVTARDARSRVYAATVTFEVLPPGAAPAISVARANDLISGIPFAAPSVINAGNVATWSLLPDAPEWLAIGSDGVVRGMPPLGTSGFSFTVVASDAYGRSTQSAQTVSLFQPTLAVTGLPATFLPGDPVSASLVTNLTSPTFTAPGRPSWLALSVGGVLTGTVPGTPGDLSFGVTAAQGDSATASVTVPLVVREVAVATPASSNGTLTFYGGQNASGLAVASAGSGWAYSLIGAPAWLGVNPMTGALTGTATNVAATTSGIKVRATRNGVPVDSAPFTAAVSPSTVTVSGLPSTVRAGSAVLLSASIGSTPATAWTWSLVNPPPWLGQPTAAGIASGTASSSAAGFRVRATHGGVEVLSGPQAITVVPNLAAVITQAPISATPGASYTTARATSSNSIGAVTWSVVTRSGTAPNSVSVADGRVTFTANPSGTWVFALRANDAFDGQAAITENITVSTNAPVATFQTSRILYVNGILIGRISDSTYFYNGVVTSWKMVFDTPHKVNVISATLGGSPRGYGTTSYSDGGTMRPFPVQTRDGASAYNHTSTPIYDAPVVVTDTISWARTSNSETVSSVGQFIPRCYAFTNHTGNCQ